MKNGWRLQSIKLRHYSAKLIISLPKSFSETANERQEIRGQDAENGCGENVYRFLFFFLILNFWHYFVTTSSAVPKGGI